MYLLLKLICLLKNSRSVVWSSSSVPHTAVSHHHLQLRVRMDVMVLPRGAGVLDRSLRPEAHKRLLRGSDLGGKRDFTSGLMERYPE